VNNDCVGASFFLGECMEFSTFFGVESEAFRLYHKNATHQLTNVTETHEKAHKNNVQNRMNSSTFDVLKKIQQTAYVSMNSMSQQARKSK